MILVDNGPEFTSMAFLSWCEAKGVRVYFIDPGKPIQSAHIENFNGRLRDECLNERWFLGLDHARSIIDTFRREYNEERPHSSQDTKGFFIHGVLVGAKIDDAVGNHHIREVLWKLCFVQVRGVELDVPVLKACLSHSLLG